MSDQPVGVSQPASTRWAAVMWLGGNWWRSTRRLSSRQRWTCRGCAEANTGVKRGAAGPATEVAQVAQESLLLHPPCCGSPHVIARESTVVEATHPVGCSCGTRCLLEPRFSREVGLGVVWLRGGSS